MQYKHLINPIICSQISNINLKNLWEYMQVSYHPVFLIWSHFPMALILQNKRSFVDCWQIAWVFQHLSWKMSICLIFFTYTNLHNVLAVQICLSKIWRATSEHQELCSHTTASSWMRYLQGAAQLRQSIMLLDSTTSKTMQVIADVQRLCLDGWFLPMLAWFNTRFASTVTHISSPVFQCTLSESRALSFWYDASFSICIFLSKDTLYIWKLDMLDV